MSKYAFFIALAWLLFPMPIWAQLQGAKNYYAVGKQAQASRNYLLAVQNFKKATFEDPGYAEAWYELGRCNCELKQTAIAKTNFQRCIEMSKTEGRRGGIVHGRNCQCGGNEYLECDVCDIFGYEQLYYPENKRVLCRNCGGGRRIACPYGKNVAAQASKLTTTGIDSYKQLADIYFDEENYETAVDYYDKYVDAYGDLEVNDSRLWYRKGYCENALGRYDFAEHPLGRSLYIEENGETYLELAYTHVKIAYPEGAIRDYRMAMSLDKGLKYEALVGIGNVFYDSLENYDSALIYFEKALLLKKEGYVCYQLGWCYNVKDRFNDAIRVLKMAMQLDVNNYYAHTQLGYAYYMLKQYDVAIAQFVVVMKKAPEDDLSRNYAGLTYAKKGDQKNLKKMIDELTALGSNEYAQELKKLQK